MGKVALLHPSFPGKFNGIPMGLLYIASALKNSGHEVVFEDFNLKKGATAQEIRAKLKALMPQIVYISSTSPTHLDACNYARLAKEELGVPVVKGGSHETFNWKTTLANHPEIDVSCVGEGEQTSVEIANVLLDRADLTSVDGIAYRDGSRITRTSPRKPEKQLDNYPHPDRSVIHKPEDYEFDIFVGKKTTQARMSRGCSYGCSFCPIESPVRFHSSDYVLEELREITEQGYQAVFWDDAIFTLNRTLMLEVLARSKAEGLELQMGAQTRADINVDPATTEAMAEGGVNYLSFGLESADPRLLHSYNKRLNPQDVAKAVRLARRQGIRTSITAIVGAPDEDLDSVKRTVHAINSMQPDSVSWSVFSIYPNTPIEFDPNWYEQPQSQDDFWLNFDEGLGSKHARETDYIQTAWRYIQDNTDSNIGL